MSAVIIILGIMMLEGLNLTGIPAVVILPAIGVYGAETNMNMMSILAITIVGSVLGNSIYYLVVRAIGPKIYHKLYDKFKGIRKSLDKAHVLIDKYGNKACCIGRVIPGVRTVISLLAGTFEISFLKFILYSTLGISLWNGALVLTGYFVNKGI